MKKTLFLIFFFSTIFCYCEKIPDELKLEIPKNINLDHYVIDFTQKNPLEKIYKQSDIDFKIKDSKQFEKVMNECLSYESLPQIKIDESRKDLMHAPFTVSFQHMRKLCSYYLSGIYSNLNKGNIEQAIKLNRAIYAVSIGFLNGKFTHNCGSLISGMLGIATGGIGLKGTKALICSGKLKRKELTLLLEYLKSYRSMVPGFEIYLGYEKMFIECSVGQMSSGILKGQKLPANNPMAKTVNQLTKEQGDKLYSEMVRYNSTYYKPIISAVESRNWSEIKNAFKKSDDFIDGLRKDLKNPADYLGAYTDPAVFIAKTLMTIATPDLSKALERYNLFLVRVSITDQILQYQVHSPDKKDDLIIKLDSIYRKLKFQIIKLRNQFKIKLEDKLFIIF